VAERSEAGWGTKLAMPGDQQEPPPDPPRYARRATLPLRGRDKKAEPAAPRRSPPLRGSDEHRDSASQNHCVEVLGLCGKRSGVMRPWMAIDCIARAVDAVRCPAPQVGPAQFARLKLNTKAIPPCCPGHNTKPRASSPRTDPCQRHEGCPPGVLIAKKSEPTITARMLADIRLSVAATHGPPMC